MNVEMKKVLVINPSMLTSLFLAGEIKKTLDMDIVTCSDLKQTVGQLERETLFHAAVVDPALADDTSGKVVDLLARYQIPVVIYASPLHAELFNTIVNNPYLILAVFNIYLVNPIAVLHYFFFISYIIFETIFNLTFF